MHRIVLPLAFLGACQPVIESPKPSLQAATPALVCNDQFTTTVTVDGNNMTPVPKGTLEEKPDLEIPLLWLSKVSELDGSAVSGEQENFELDQTTRWVAKEVMEFDVNPEVYSFMPGVHDLWVQNLDSQDAMAEQAFAVTPPPTVAAIDPNLLCVDQADQNAVLTGTGFLEVTGTNPTTTIGPIDIEPDSMDDCFNLAGPVTGKSCNTANLTIEQQSLDPGVYDITMTNPETAQCASVETLQLEIVPPPELETFVPDLTCIDQMAKSYTLTGKNFLRLADGTLPMVALSDATGTNTYEALADSAQNCTPLTGPAGGDLCTELTYTLPMDQLPPTAANDPGVISNVYGVVVTNPPPADCFSTEIVNVEIVPQPTLTEVEPTGPYTADDPAGTCVIEGTRDFDLSGTGFVELADGTVPTVMVGTHMVAAADIIPSGCTALSGPSGGQSCTTLSITLPMNYNAPGTHNVVVTNPGDANCNTEEPLTLDAFPEPVLSALALPLQPVTCNDAVTNVTLTGTDFVVVNGVYPTVNIGGFAIEADSCNDASAADTSTAYNSFASTCTSLSVAVPSGSLTEGVQTITVENPGPLGCTTNATTVTIDVLPAPVINMLTPPGACDLAQAVDLEIDGAGFLTNIGGNDATVTVGGNAMTPDFSGGTCTAAPGGVGSSCDQIDLTIAGNTFSSLGDYDVVVTNPAPAQCSVTTVFSYSDPPTITSTDPPQICLDPLNGFTLTVNGTNFTQNSSIIILEEGGTLGTPQAPGDEIRVPTTFVSAAQVTGAVPAGALNAGNFDVFVDNGGGGSCLVQAGDNGTGNGYALVVTELPILFFVDPPVVPNVVPVTATAFVSGINDAVTQIDIEEVNNPGVLINIPNFRWNALEPAVVEFDLPDSLTEGFYNLIVSDATGCVPELDDAFYVEGNTDLTLNAIDPPFGWTNAFTPVTIDGTGTPAFLDTPRLYLSPSNPGPGATATELRAVEFNDGATLDAVVPDNLAVDTYDVIVVNPGPGGTAEVGLIPGGFEVLSNQPPTIDNITPGSIPTSATVVTITGAGFDDSAGVTAPVIDVECYNPGADDCNSTGNGIYTCSTATANCPTPTLNQPVVSAWTPTSITATFDGANINNNVCVVTVTKTTDNTYGRYSSLSVTNPSGNPYGWRRAEELSTPRMQLMAAAGRATRTRRFLYAIGGDDGTQTLDTIERARLDPFGNLGPWSDLPDTLPMPMRSAGIQKIGRFIYLVGGVDDQGNPLATTWRAQILDPLAAPKFTTNLSVALDPVGMDPGTYIYRVAALFDTLANDDDDPDGESLPSDAFVVRLPSVGTDKLQLTLEWTAVPDAIGYRIYRSDTGSGGEEWLADVGNQLTFTDIGNATTAGPLPKPSGSLGEWAALDDMDEAREAPCVGWGLDPADNTMAYLFVAGGDTDGAGATTDSIAYLPISLVNEYDHDTTTWTPSAFVLSGARFECGGFSVTNELHSRVNPGDSWVYFGGGNEGNGAANPASKTDAGLVAAGGDFDFGPDNTANTSDDFYYLDTNGPTGEAYVFAAASNYLYSFGGPGSGSGQSGEICTYSSTVCNTATPPILRNFNGTGTSMCDNRGWAGSAQESSVIFAIGGDDGIGPTTTVDFTNY